MYNVNASKTVLLSLLNSNDIYAKAQNFDLARYLQKRQLFFSTYDISNNFNIDAVLPDFVNNYADNISPKAFDPLTVDYRYQDLNGSAGRREQTLLDLGNDFLYQISYSQPFIQPNQKWYHLSSNHRQLLSILNSRIWRTGLMGFGSTAVRFSGTKHTRRIDSLGDETDITESIIDSQIINNPASYFVRFDNSGNEIITEIFYTNCVLIPENNHSTIFANSYKMVFKFRDEDSLSGNDVTTWDFSTISVADENETFEIRTTKPVGAIEDGEDKENTLQYNRGITVLPIYTMPQLMTLLQVPY